MIVEHNPWGRPGGGAPNKEIRIKNLAIEGLYPESGQDCRNIPPAFRYRPSKAGGGGGAPIRSASGRLLTNYCDDPILGFNEPTRNYVDIELRYKTSARNKKHYKMQLDSIVAEKERDKAAKKRISIDVDKRLHMLHDPWGRPGPGGNPWRPPHSVGNKFLQSLGWTSKNDLQWIDRETNKPIQHASGERKNFTDSEKLKNNQENNFSCCNKCTCCTNQYSNEPAATNPLATADDTDAEHNRLRKPCLKKSNPPQLYRHASRNCIVSPRARPCMITGGVELVPLLAKRRAEQRPISLSTTDVTRYKDGKGDWKECSVQYLNDLNRQIAYRERNSRLLHDVDVQSSKKHFETWNSFWGRPGHGAPRPVKNKLKLDDLLYKMPLK